MCEICILSPNDADQRELKGIHDDLQSVEPSDMTDQLEVLTRGHSVLAGEKSSAPSTTEEFATGHKKKRKQTDNDYVNTLFSRSKLKYRRVNLYQKIYQT